MPGTTKQFRGALVCSGVRTAFTDHVDSISDAGAPSSEELLGAAGTLAGGLLPAPSISAKPISESGSRWPWALAVKCLTK